MARLLVRLMEAQARWAGPFGDFNHRWVSALFRPITPIRDFLNGRWLGHPLHAALSDGPVGILFLAIVFDLLGVGLDMDGAAQAANVALLVGILAMVATAVAGLADYSVTDGAARTRATLHGTLMVLALVLYVAAFAVRVGPASVPVAGVALSILAFLILIAGTYVGGNVVFALGNMVSRHAFRRGGAKWAPLDLVPGTEIAEGVLTKARLGAEPLVIVRTGDLIRALHDQCAHAGGPLSTGALVDGCLECPWHASLFRLGDGAVVRGPAVYDQPAYEVRRTEGGAWEARRRAG